MDERAEWEGRMDGRREREGRGGMDGEGGSTDGRREAGKDGGEGGSILRHLSIWGHLHGENNIIDQLVQSYELVVLYIKTVQVK